MSAGCKRNALGRYSFFLRTQSRNDYSKRGVNLMTSSLISQLTPLPQKLLLNFKESVIFCNTLRAA